jgi:hypothetical protein
MHWRGEKRKRKGKEKGMNGLDSVVGRLMFVEKLPVGWDRADVFFEVSTDYTD